MTAQHLTVLGFYGTTLDAGGGPTRWSKWRPTVSLFHHEDLLIDRLVLLVQKPDAADALVDDVRRLSPDTEVVKHLLPLANPWDFEGVFEALHGLARELQVEGELWVHLTTGSHVAQICLFLLTESRFLPGKLLQSAPPSRAFPRGRYDVVDLDLARYDRIAARFEQEQVLSTAFLKAGIETQSPSFNRLIEQIEVVAGASTAPMLLTGPTGAGKSRLARKIYELKRQRRQLDGPLVEVNCATLRGDQAMSALFGHTAGAFTGAVKARPGLLRSADGGLLFLDEIGELGMDEQAMLLRAVEEKRFLPVGSDAEVASEFQLIAGTNRDLRQRVREGAFRGDLLARIDLWHFGLPGLADRREDIEPNVAYELEQFARREGRRVSFNREAKRQFLRFATSMEAKWEGNFRDLSAAVTRMATLATSGRIGVPDVEQEIMRLQRAWSVAEPQEDRLREVLGDRVETLDRFDRVQLADVLAVCAKAHTQSEAGRVLFAVSRQHRKTVNDADRLRKYLARFELTWEDVR